MDGLPVRRAVRWLNQRQNADGGWAESGASYVEVEARGRGESTPSQTAWALLGLIAAERADSPAAHRGAPFPLVRRRPGEPRGQESFSDRGLRTYRLARALCR